MHVLDRARTIGVDDLAQKNSWVPGANVSIRKAIQAEGAQAFNDGDFGRAEMLATLYRHVCYWAHQERQDRRSRAIIPYVALDGSARFMEVRGNRDAEVEVMEVFREMQAASTGRQPPS